VFVAIQLIISELMCALPSMNSLL